MEADDEVQEQEAPAEGEENLDTAEETEEEDEELKEILAATKEEKPLTLGETNRFKKIYGKMKTFEREKTAFHDRLNEQDTITVALIEQNKQLMETLKDMQKGVDSNTSASIEADIVATRTALRNAIKDGDVDAQAELSEKLIELGVKKATPKVEKKEDEVDLLKKKESLVLERHTKAREAFLVDPANADILLNEDNTLIAQAMSAKLAKNEKYKTLPPEEFWRDVATETRKLLGKGKSVGKKANLETGIEGNNREKSDSSFQGLDATQRSIARKSFPALDPEEAYKNYKDGLEMIAKMKRGL